jgi:hypothetical protein
MRSPVLLLGACLLGALAACSDSDPALPASEPGEIVVLAVNGAPLAGQPAVLDSLYVTAELRLSPTDRAVAAAELVLADGRVLARTAVSAAPGATAPATLGTYEIASGEHRVVVRGRAADETVVVTSDTVTVTVSRPATYARILALNGAPLPQNSSRAAVADSFALDLVLVTADGEPALDRISVLRDTRFPAPIFYLGDIRPHLLLQEMELPPGRTSRLKIKAWVAVPGSYSISLEFQRYQRLSSNGIVVAVHTIAKTEAIPVTVTNSDVTPPVILKPANGATVSSSVLQMEVSDPRGVWIWGLAIPCPHVLFEWVPGPTTTATVSGTRSVCLSPGANRVIRYAVDTAGNTVTDTVTVNFVPGGG